MKKVYLISLIFIFGGCGNSSDNMKNNNTNDSAAVPTNQADTVKQPSGVDNSSVISTDTAAINVQNSIRKADSAKQK